MPEIVNIRLPYNYTARPYQVAFWEAMKAGKKRAVLVWHRRAGKEKTCWNYLVMRAAVQKGIYYYFFPFFSQARKILWDGCDKAGNRFLDHIPAELIYGNKNNTEMKLWLKNGSLIQMIGVDNIDCYDKETEVLTESGWRLFKDLDIDDRVASLVNGNMEFVLPEKRVEYPYKGPMVSFKNSSNDLLVTPNHRFYIKSAKGVYKFKTHDQLASCDSIPSISGWVGKDREFFEFPYESHTWACGKGRVCEKEYNRKMPMEKFVALLGIFLSEGSTYSDQKTYRILISQKKEETKREILDLLEGLGINYSVNKSNISFEDKQLFNYFSQFGLCDEKYIPRDIKALSPKYLKILFEWLVKGDGSVQRGVVSYYSTSKRLIDDVQEIILKLGMNGYVTEKKQKNSYIRGRLIVSKKKLYAIQVRRSNYKYFRSTKSEYISKIEYDGMVYCVSVPSGIIKVRRHGKEAWCGNSIVGTNPVGCVFSEYSLQDPNAWQFIRPILAENEGWAVFNFCVDKDTMVFTENGIQRIKTIVPKTEKEFTEIDLSVYGINGYNKAISFYNGGMKSLLKITTEKGYELSCTPNHPILSTNGWKKAEEWKIGDYIPIQRGQNCWGKGIDISEWTKPDKRKSHKDLPLGFKLDRNLAYLLGLILAEGSWNHNSVTITNADPEIIEWLRSRGFVSYDKFHHVYCSEEFISFIEWMGLKKGAKNKDFPEKILLCGKEIVAALISGYFDGDGCATKRGGIHCDSVSEDLIKQLQVVLLNFGIIGNRKGYHVKPTKRVKVSSFVWRLELTQNGAQIFYNEIGFRLKRKQERRSSLKKRFKDHSADEIPYEKSWAKEYSRGLGFTNHLCINKHITYKTAKAYFDKKPDKWLEEVIKSDYFYDKVKTIEVSEGEVFDFVIPETHSFCSNGIISHNTPRGQNHSKELYDMAKFNPEWFTQLLTVEDTGVLSPADIQRERDAGMSEDFIQQEFYCSFSLGIEGSYYAYYMQNALNDRRIGNVPYDRNAKVHTSWDIGYGDSCAIIFFQIIGNEIHIIDCIEDHGKSVSHYIELINAKKYIYGEHFGPHDIANRHFSSGLSTKEVALDLGFDFYQLPTLRMTIEEGIEASRSIFPRVWIDERKCKDLIKALENYRKEFDDRHTVYKEKPLHNWASHYADAFRYMAIAVKMRVDKVKSGIDDAEADRLFHKHVPNFS